jgi:N-glycosylase/DNA lyase
MRDGEERFASPRLFVSRPVKHARLPRLPFSAALDPEALLHPEVPTRIPTTETTDLQHTFRCGQVFRWRRVGEWWYGPFGQSALAVRETPGTLEVRSVGASLTTYEAWRFLGLDFPLEELCRHFGTDRWLSRAVSAAPGMRILRQDPWDCTAGYICSQNSNIPKIELSTERVARRWGTVHRWPEGVETATFPRAEALAELEASALKETALGYRCRYLVDSARLVAAGAVELPALRGEAYADALEALLTLPGIGRKVADCIMVFSLDQSEAFPVDVWVRRVLHELYPAAISRYLPDFRSRGAKPLSAREYAAITQFAWARWGKLAGYAQQYLFHTRRLGLITGP